MKLCNGFIVFLSLRKVSLGLLVRSAPIRMHMEMTVKNVGGVNIVTVHFLIYKYVPYLIHETDTDGFIMLICFVYYICT